MQSSREEAAINWLDGLPSEIWHLIFGEIHSGQDLQQLLQVCASFYKWIKGVQFWPYVLPDKVDYTRLQPEKLAHTICEIKQGETYFINWLYNGDMVVALPDGGIRWLSSRREGWVSFAGRHMLNDKPIKAQLFAAFSYGRAATVSDDGMRIWDKTTGEQLQFLPVRHAQEKIKYLILPFLDVFIMGSEEGGVYFYMPDSDTGGIPYRYIDQFPYPSSSHQDMQLKHLENCDPYLIGQFDQCIVLWKIKNRTIEHVIYIAELQAKLEKMIKEIQHQDLFTRAELQGFSLEENKGLTFDFSNRFPGLYFGVVVNKTFEFFVSLKEKDLKPFFMGLYGYAEFSSDREENFYLYRSKRDEAFEVLMNWDEAAQTFKTTREYFIFSDQDGTFIPCGSLCWHFGDSGHQVELWDSDSATVRLINLETPAVDPNIFQNTTSLKFKIINTNHIMASDKKGIIVIWDGLTGKLEKEIDTTAFIKADLVNVRSRFFGSSICFHGQERERGERHHMGMYCFGLKK